MIEVLNLMVKELVQSDLTVEELKSLSKEVSKNSGLVNRLYQQSDINFRCINRLNGE